MRAVQPARIERCPGCQSAASLGWGREPLDVPVFCNVLHGTRHEAIDAARGKIELRMCTSCGLVWNSEFEEELVRYAPGYENSLHFSPVFGDYARRLASNLVARFGVQGGMAVEIGCGRGDFLVELARQGVARGVGFDPSAPSDSAPAPGVVVHARRASMADLAGAQLICCRHVLEHVRRPGEIADLIVGSGVPFYVEVPDATHMLSHVGCWDIIYEHFTYFSASALTALFQSAGSINVDCGVAFDGQFLWATGLGDAEELGGRHPDPENLSRFRFLGREIREKLDAWDARVTELASSGPVVVWGAGSKGVTFLNLMRVPSSVQCIVDVNPRKWGRHVPGTGHEVIRPQDLPGLDPGTVLVMNQAYLGEIESQLRALRYRGRTEVVGDRDTVRTAAGPR